MKQRPNNWPKRVGTFLNNYRAVIFLAAAILLSSSAFSQVDTTKALQYINAYGYRYKNMGFDSSLRVPADTFKLSFRDTSALAFKGKVLYRWGGNYWKPVAAKINDSTFIINGDTVRVGSSTTNLSKSYTSTTFTISPSSGGTPVTIDPATNSSAGTMTAANKRSLDSAITKIIPLNDSVLGYYNSLGVLVKTDTSKAFKFVLPLKVVGQSAKLDYDTNSLAVINNKLAAKITTVKNIGELRSLPSYDTSMIYRLMQNKVVGDFYFVGGCSDADDSAMNISVTGGCLKRYTAGIVRPEYFGAINNDLLDDSYAFQKMWNWIGANAGVDKREEYTVIFTGKYYQNTTVTLPKFLYNQGGWPTVRVSGYGATIVLSGAITGMKRVPVSMNEAIYDTQNMIGNSRWTFEGLTFLGDLTTGQKALELGALYSANIKDNYFSALDTALVARFVLGSVIMNNQFINNKSVAMLLSHGNWTSANSSNAAFNANYVNKNRIYCGNGSYTAILMEAGDGNDISNTIIEGSKPRYSIVVDSKSSSVVNGNHIRTMWFESSGGVYANNTAMKLAVSGIMTIDGIQNDSPDTLIDWSGSSAGADISLDNVEYWNFSAGTWFKGTPASGMVFRIGRVYGTLTENLFNPAKYLDGIPSDVFTLYGYQTAAGGYGITSTSQISIKPNLNAASGSKVISIFGNPKPSTDNTFDLGSGSLRWSTTYSNKFLSGLTSEDGTGSGFQSSTGVSVGDGYRVTNPNGSARIAFSSGGLQMQYFSGTYATLKLDPSLTYTHGGVTRMTLYNNGHFRLGASMADNGQSLQVDGSTWLNGSLQIIDGNQAVGKILTSDASGNATWQTPSGSSYTFTNGLTNSSGTVSLGGAFPNSTTQITGGGASSSLYFGGGSGLATTTIEAGTTQIIGAFATTGTHTITSGTSATVNNDVSRVVINPGSVIASYTLTLSATPVDGEEIMIFFGGTIAGGATVVTSLTISANTGQTLMQPTTPSTAVGGDCIIYKYLSSNSTWYRVR